MWAGGAAAVTLQVAVSNSRIPFVPLHSWFCPEGRKGRKGESGVGGKKETLGKRKRLEHGNMKEQATKYLVIKRQPALVMSLYLRHFSDLRR